MEEECPSDSTATDCANGAQTLNAYIAQLSSFTSSATGKRRRRSIMETRPPSNDSSVSTFLQRPPGRSTVVFDQFPASFKFHLGTIVATRPARKKPTA